MYQMTGYGDRYNYVCKVVIESIQMHLHVIHSNLFILSVSYFCDVLEMFWHCLSVFGRGKALSLFPCAYLNSLFDLFFACGYAFWNAVNMGVVPLCLYSHFFGISCSCGIITRGCLIWLYICCFFVSHWDFLLSIAMKFSLLEYNFLAYFIVDRKVEIQNKGHYTCEWLGLDSGIYNSWKMKYWWHICKLNSIVILDFLIHGFIIMFKVLWLPIILCCVDGNYRTSKSHFFDTLRWESVPSHHKNKEVGKKKKKNHPLLHPIYLEYEL